MTNSSSPGTGPSPDLLGVDYPAGLEDELLALDAATAQAVLDVLDEERQQTLRIRDAWAGVAAETGPHFTEGDTLGAVVARMPEPGRARALEHLRVLEAAGVVPSGPGL
ncbi:hypothetical protein [Streptomyces sp. NPDC059979]|uniref:hypothetical protein n=1 Tax=Streptomyces sp. NPDC059979 TaxID=3347021 RepID=UPI003698B553